MPTNDPSVSSLLSTGDVAAILGVSRQHVVDLCQRGDLPYVMVGTHRRVPRSAVDQIVAPQRSLTREEERSLWLHRALVTPLVTRPDAVIGTARENLSRWRQSQRSDGMAAHHLAKWEEILDAGVDQVIEVVTSTDVDACELRQSSPFAGVLSDDVRRQVLRSFKSHWAREHEGQLAS